MTRGYHAPGFPIWQAATAKAANNNYFKHLSTLQAGITKRILGHIKGDMRDEVSYFIVRRAHREPHTIQQMQQKVAGMRGYMRAPRTAYHIDHCDYVIARQSWKDGAIEELEVHDTLPAAKSAFKAVTGLGYQSKQQRINDE